MTEERQGLEAKQRMIVFLLGTERYAVPLLQVREVIALPQVTAVPDSPAHFLGITNLRGTVIPVIDLRLKLKIGKVENTHETAVMILDVQGKEVGAVVCAIDNVLSVARAEIKDCPQLESSNNREFIHGVIQNGNQMVLLLDAVRVLSRDERGLDSRQLTARSA